MAVDFKNKTIGILGLSFKPNTDDVRDSASIEMIKVIEEEGGVVNAFDPVANDSMKRVFPDIAIKILGKRHAMMLMVL